MIKYHGKERLMKKKFSKSTIAVLAVATVLSAMPVFGATNYNWSGYASTPGSSIVTGEITKRTDSSVIVNYSSGSSEFMGVTVLAKTNGSWHDCTYYSSSHPIYYAYKGASNYVDVLNNVHEDHGDCPTKANFVATSAGNHSGKWRPDFQ